MAAAIFKMAVSSGRTKICCFRGPVFNNLSSKLILPSCTTVTQRSILHTSGRNKQQLFELEKNRKEGTTHWFNERVVAVALLGLIPAAYVYPHIAIDHAFAVLLPLHSYWGVDAIIGDYLWRPIVPALKIGWLLLCVLSGVGLVCLNVNDVGVTKLFTQFITL